MKKAIVVLFIALASSIGALAATVNSTPLTEGELAGITGGATTRCISCTSGSVSINLVTMTASCEAGASMQVAEGPCGNQ